MTSHGKCYGSFRSSFDYYERREVDALRLTTPWPKAVETTERQTTIKIQQTYKPTIDRHEFYQNLLTISCVLEW